MQLGFRITRLAGLMQTLQHGQIITDQLTYAAFSHLRLLTFGTCYLYLMAALNCCEIWCWIKKACMKRLAVRVAAWTALCNTYHAHK